MTANHFNVFVNINNECNVNLSESQIFRGAREIWLVWWASSNNGRHVTEKTAKTDSQMGKWFICPTVTLWVSYEKNRHQKYYCLPTSEVSIALLIFLFPHISKRSHDRAFVSYICHNRSLWLLWFFFLLKCHTNNFNATATKKWQAQNNSLCLFTLSNNFDLLFY